MTLKDIDIKTSAAPSHGLYARGAGSITAEGINIITSGKGSYGVQTSDGDVTLTNSTIKTSGANSFGAFAAASAGHLSISDITIWCRMPINGCWRAIATMWHQEIQARRAVVQAMLAIQASR